MLVSDLGLSLGGLCFWSLVRQETEKRAQSPTVSISGISQRLKDLPLDALSPTNNSILGSSTTHGCLEDTPPNKNTLLARSCFS